MNLFTLSAADTDSYSPQLLHTKTATPEASNTGLRVSIIPCNKFAMFIAVAFEYRASCNSVARWNRSLYMINAKAKR